MNLCKCGCGTPVNKTWVTGHNRKGTTYTIDKVKDKNYIRNKFKSKFVEDEITGCWNWIGWKCQGYGGMYCHWESDDPKIYPAHRLSYLIYIEEIPDELQILHRCNNKRCVNPFHLYAGTHEDNMRDLRDSGVLSNEKKSKLWH